MILILRAALFGAAQEVIVVYEGATTSHNVANHSGSQYAWEVYINFNPGTKAPPGDYEIIGTAGSDQIQIKWLSTGIFYLKVTETDLKGCENLRVLPVSVIPNDRSIGFLSAVSSSCFDQAENGFSLPLIIKGSDGLSLEATYFPLIIELKVNNKAYSQNITYENQVVLINNDWIASDLENQPVINVEISSARDARNNAIMPGAKMNIHKRTINAFPQLAFVTAEALIERGSRFTHEVQLENGNQTDAVYHWRVEPVGGSTTNFDQISGSSATVLWDGLPGVYTLRVWVTDGNGCVSDTISQFVEITNLFDFYLSAGRDTIIGSCHAYQLQADIQHEPGLTYTCLWKPSENLDDPTAENPVFTPGNTTTFVVTVTSSSGETATDSVKITVHGVFANAGNDLAMWQGSTAMLDGSGSSGDKITYRWTTTSGNIETGANTATPVVSGFGDYYLLVTDSFGCTGYDTVNVSRLTQAPVAADDYDTTSYQRELIIDVLANDTDSENNIDKTSLTISSPPFNGTAYIDYDNHTVHYKPNSGFNGTDVFEYQICNIYNQCDDANVFVLVTDFNFMIPNAFSPNGDGINDYFEILGIEYYENNSITIINRWGNKVYEAKRYGIDANPVFWNGKSNTGFRLGNDELPTGTYYYILDLGNGEKPVSGSIYLDR